MLKLYARIGEGEAPAGGARMWAYKIEPYWALVVRIFLAALFIYSAWHKIEDPVSFQMKVYEYDFPPSSWVEFVSSWTGFDFHPEEWTGPASRAFPWLMVISGVFLLFGFLSRGGALLQVLLLLLFTAAIEVNIYREAVMSCGCFSEEGHSIGIDLVVRNLFLLVLSGYVLDRGPGRFSVDRFLLKIYRGLGGKNLAKTERSKKIKKF